MIQQSARGALCATIVLATLLVRLDAQQPPGGPRNGTPTVGTPQPDPPNPADRITLTGCVRLAAAIGPAPTAAQTPADSRFVLINVKKESRVPAGTGTSAAAASPAADSYRLEALDSQLSPFIGAHVEISGEVRALNTAAGAAPPVLLVEFVQKIATACQGA
jgi:hypothetical protein